MATRKTPQKAQHLLQVVTQEVEEKQLRNDIIDLIESIMVYKFPQMSRKEIAAMLGVDDLKQTRFYQEVFTEGKQEGKLEAVSRMLDLGLDWEVIAQALDLTSRSGEKGGSEKILRSQATNISH